MNEEAAKANLLNYLKHERHAVLAKLDGLSEYDVRRPLTVTGTNLLGLVKHLATWEARYLGEVFDRPFPNRSLGGTPRKNDLPTCGRQRASRARVSSTDTGASGRTATSPWAPFLADMGRVAWWGDAEVPLFNVLVHMLAETSRHAGHADILREQLDGAVGTDADAMAEQHHDAVFWAERREEIKAAANSAR